jgi:DNA-binding transcriptional LysR family regulator
MLGPIKDLKQRQRQDWRKLHSGTDSHCWTSAILFSADKLVSGGVSLVDFDQLTTFLEVVKLGNFSRAGEKVFRSQSAVSAQIRQLEQDYGTKLLDRSGKRVSLTPAGEVLFEYANRLLALRGESLRAVVDQDNTPRGVLAVGANEATCLYVLPETFGEYRRRYSDVQISIYRNFSHKILERLQDGLIDVGIVTMPVKANRLVVKRIFHDRLVLMTGPNHPLGKLNSVSVEAMVEYPIILPKAGHTRKTMDKLFRPYQSQLRIAMELPSIAMIKAFVSSGMGISLISESFARKECRAGDLRLVPLSDTDLSRELALVYHQDRTLPRSAVAFIEMVRNGLPRFRSAGAFELESPRLIESHELDGAFLEA